MLAGTQQILGVISISLDTALFLFFMKFACKALSNRWMGLEKGQVLKDLAHYVYGPCRLPYLLFLQCLLASLSATSLKKSESLGTITGERISKADMVEIWSKKLHLAFCMQEEVAQLRGYLVAHVGSLNLRITTQRL